MLRLILSSILLVTLPLSGGEEFDVHDVMRTRLVTSAVVSPDGQKVAYTLRVPRTVSEEAGGAYAELHLLDVRSGDSRGFITGEVNVSNVQWQPGGKAVSFTSRRDGQKSTQVWSIPVDGGEASCLTDAASSVLDYRWLPDGKQIAYIATTPKSARRKALEDKGYGFIFYEEALRHRNLYLQNIKSEEDARQVTEDMTVWTLEIAPDGQSAAITASPKNLIDHRYAFRTIHMIDFADGKTREIMPDARKLNNMAFSPDGKMLAFSAALTKSDHQVSQAFILPLTGGDVINLTPPKFRGHVSEVAWKDNNTLIYQADEGTQVSLNTVGVKSKKRKVLLNSTADGVIFGFPSWSDDGKVMAATGTTPSEPANVYVAQNDKKFERKTRVNPWLAAKKLHPQSVYTYTTRDGAQVEGILIRPASATDKPSPLIMIVHGGPESHYSNGWMTSYSRPGQVLATKGYAVFYANYRGSTGYGVDFAAYNMGDPAGKEFDDVADAIDSLVEDGIAERERVGMGGGSYGGFASAWFATYYTKYVRAVCMSVGISDLISKRGTTDIPYEELFVHSGKKLEEMWEISLKRSPIYYAHQSKTATLIHGGADDPRVHPSQSLELYRRMKMNDHPAVRLVQYPGEGHGNRRQPGRLDVLLRTLDWWDWYVRDLKPLDGPMPALDISEQYGLTLPQD